MGETLIRTNDPFDTRSLWGLLLYEMERQAMLELLLITELLITDIAANEVRSGS